MATAPLMLYDGSCGFCAASVQFILRHERQHTLRFAALESELGDALRARHPQLTGVDSMIWVDEQDGREHIQVRSGAALQAARYLGGTWGALGAIGALFPAPLRDGVYNFIARHRHRIMREPEQCYIPPPAVRARFLS